MKILTISDEECPALWDYYIHGRLDGYDLIIACGDLNAKYLSFLVTMARVPVLYVHGNHDVNYDLVPPEGCTSPDDMIKGCSGFLATSAKTSPSMNILRSLPRKDDG